MAQVGTSKLGTHRLGDKAGRHGSGKLGTGTLGGQSPATDEPSVKSVSASKRYPTTQASSMDAIAEPTAGVGYTGSVAATKTASSNQVAVQTASITVGSTKTAFTDSQAAVGYVSELAATGTTYASGHSASVSYQLTPNAVKEFASGARTARSTITATPSAGKHATGTPATATCSSSASVTASKFATAPAQTAVGAYSGSVGASSVAITAASGGVTYPTTQTAIGSWRDELGAGATYSVTPSAETVASTSDGATAAFDTAVGSSIGTVRGSATGSYSPTLSVSYSGFADIEASYAVPVTLGASSAVNFNHRFYERLDTGVLTNNVVTGVENMSDINRKRNDTIPITHTLTENGDAANLSKASKVEFFMSKSPTEPLKAGGTGEILDEANGEVMYNFGPEEVDEAGLFLAEWQVTYLDETVLTFPNDRNMIIEFTEDLSD